MALKKNMHARFKVRDLRSKEKHVIDDQYLNTYARLCGVYATAVYNSLSRHANSHTQECFPSTELIAKQLPQRLHEWPAGVYAHLRLGEEQRSCSQRACAALPRWHQAHVAIENLELVPIPQMVKTFNPEGRNQYSQPRTSPSQVQQSILPRLHPRRIVLLGNLHRRVPE